MNSWKGYFGNKDFMIQFVFFLIANLIVVSSLPFFFQEIIGPKPGIRIHDPILNFFSPSDHSWAIFALIYLSLFLLLQGLYEKPERVLLGLRCYLILNLLRMLSMYLITLEAPEGIIPLKDPLVDVIAYGGKVFTKDLFFSGHVATLTLFTLLEERSPIKILLSLITIVVAGLILLQRIHYTLDVLAAPVITILIVTIITKRFRQIKVNVPK